VVLVLLVLVLEPLLLRILALVVAEVEHPVLVAQVVLALCM
jgi:hypothetical protein